MAEVTLGLPGPWAEDYREKSDHYTTKIGGIPDWPVPDMGFAQKYQRCKLCGQKMCLVAQVYAPISWPMLNVEERVIYVLGCLSPKCGSDHRSWRALRFQKSSSGSYPECGNQNKADEASCSPVSGTSKSRGDSHMNVFDEFDGGGDGINLQELTDAFSQASVLASNSKSRTCCTRPKKSKKSPVIKVGRHEDDVPVVPCFYLFFEKESSSNGINAGCSSFTSLSIKESRNESSGHEDEEKWNPEDYEYDRASGADRTYLKFKKAVDLNPSQCLRYSYGGKPLIATTNLGETTNCELCGSPLQYEMQLMAPVIYFLRQAADNSSTCPPEQWSWLTLILRTCSESCFPSSSVEEGVPGDRWAVAEETVIIQDED